MCSQNVAYCAQNKVRVREVRTSAMENRLLTGLATRIVAYNPSQTAQVRVGQNRCCGTIDYLAHKWAEVDEEMEPCDGSCIGAVFFEGFFDDMLRDAVALMCNVLVLS